MKKTLLLLLFLPAICRIAMAQQIEVHTDLIKTSAKNTAYKVAKNTLYQQKLKEIQKYRDSIAVYTTAIEEIQRTTYNALTNANAAILQGKTVWCTLQKIPVIVSNCSKIIAQSAGNPMLIPFATWTKEQLLLRTENLQNFLEQVLLKASDENLMNPVTRSVLVQSIYTEIDIMETLTEVILNKYKLYSTQKLINELTPLIGYINLDKQKMTYILERIKGI